MKEYAYILGRQPEIATAEIIAAFRAEFGEDLPTPFELFSEYVLIARSKDRQNAQRLFERLGGSVKLVEILEEGLSDSPVDSCERILLDFIQAQDRTSVDFGLSAYGDRPLEGIDSLSKELKSRLQNADYSARYVKPKSDSKGALSSVQVAKRGLLSEAGIELCLLQNRSRIILGKTIQVQDFEEFSERDYSKPHRDIDPGLLPPKLARIMTNLAAQPAGAHILDPFCGSGVVLMEALLLGYRVTGVDLSGKAVSASKENLAWLANRGSRPLPEWSVKSGDARLLVRQFGPHSFDAAVGEGDLGPLLKRAQKEKEILELAKQYRMLYITCLAELRSVVRPGGRVVLAVPAWKRTDGKIVGLKLDRDLRLMGYRKVDLFDRLSTGNVSNRRSLQYCRPDQYTAREILVLDV